MRILRPVQVVLLLTTVFVHILSKSLNYSTELLTCFDNMDAFDLTFQIQNEQQTTYKRYLCNQEKTAIELYNLCYSQATPTHQNTKLYHKLGSSLAVIFRPHLRQPKAYVEIHNLQCSPFEDLLVYLK